MILFFFLPETYNKRADEKRAKSQPVQMTVVQPQKADSARVNSRYTTLPVASNISTGTRMSLLKFGKK